MISKNVKKKRGWNLNKIPFLYIFKFNYIFFKRIFCILRVVVLIKTAAVGHISGL